MAERAGQDALLAELADELAGQVTRRYRLGRAEAAALILDDFKRQPKLLSAISVAGSAAEVRRLRVYRDAADATKRSIYHQLRRYLARPASFDDALSALAGLPAGADPGQITDAAMALAAAHVSTAERLPRVAEFLGMLETALEGGGIVLDVGCGVHPLLMPPGWLASHGVREYWALDRDGRALAAVAEYARVLADGRIRPVQWDIASGWEPLLQAGLPRRCAAGLMLKLVPVVARQSPELLPVLAAAPADRLLISGSRTAMARRQDIERRELRAIQRFCAEYDLVASAPFSTADEICLRADRTGRTGSRS